MKDCLIILGKLLYWRFISQISLARNLQRSNGNSTSSQILIAGEWRDFTCCVLALLPLLNFEDSVVFFSIAVANPSKYACTISGSISISLTQESSISEKPSQ